MKKTISVMLIMLLLLSQMVAFAHDNPIPSWAKEAVDTLMQMGVIEGRGNGNLALNSNVTREEFAKMLSLTFEMDIDENAKTRYIDIEADRWSVKYIEACAEYIIHIAELHPEEMVYSSLRYGPQVPATRLEIAVAVARALGYEDGGEAESSFVDAADIPEKYAEHIAFATESGILIGYEDGTFRPFNNVTRAEAAVMLYRAWNIDSTPDISPTPVVSPTPEASSTPEASATPEATTTPTPSGIPTIPPGNHVAVIKSVSKVVLNDEHFTKLVVCYGGDAADVELYADEDTKVIGAKSDIANLTTGDTILFSYYLSSGELAAVYVMYSVEQAAAYTGENYTSLLSLPQSTNYGDYGLYDDGSEVCLYYGRLIKTRSISTGILITLQGSTDDEVDVYVPTDLSVLRNTVRNGSSNQRFSNVTIADFKDNRDNTFVFVRIKDQETIDAMIIDFE